jgi:hypothetical protein
MTIPDLIAALLRQAEIAGSTDRGAVYAEAAARLAELAEDGERLDWIEAERARIEPPHGPDGWIVIRRDWTWWFTGAIVRNAIDAARKSKEN